MVAMIYSRIRVLGVPSDPISHGALPAQLIAAPHKAGTVKGGSFRVAAPTLTLLFIRIVFFSLMGAPTASATSFEYQGMLLSRGDEFHRFVAQEASNWKTANAYCASQGMHLATFRDSDQWDEAHHHLRGCGLGGMTTYTAHGVFYDWNWVASSSPETHRFNGMAALFGSSFRVDSLSPRWNVGYWVWDAGQPNQYNGGHGVPEIYLALRSGACNDVPLEVTVDPKNPPDTRYGSAACVKFRCNSVDDCNGNAVDDPAAVVQYFNRSTQCACNCKANFSGPTCWHAGASEGSEHYVKFTGTHQTASVIATACAARHPYMFAASAETGEQYAFMAAYGGDGCQIGATGSGFGTGIKWLEGRWGSTVTTFTIAKDGTFSNAAAMHYRLRSTDTADYTLVSMGGPRVSLCYLCAFHVCNIDSDCAMHAEGSVIAVDGLWPNCSCTVLNQNDELTRLSFISPSVAELGVPVKGDSRADAEAAVDVSPHNHGNLAEQPLGAQIRSRSQLNAALTASRLAWDTAVAMGESQPNRFLAVFRNAAHVLGAQTIVAIDHDTRSGFRFCRSSVQCSGHGTATSPLVPAAAGAPATKGTKASGAMRPFSSTE